MPAIIRNNKVMCLAALVALLAFETSAFSSIPSSRTATSASASNTARSVSASPTQMLPEGLVKTVVNGGNPNDPLIARGDVVTVKYTCYSTNGDGDDNNVLLARSDSQKMVCNRHF